MDVNEPRPAAVLWDMDGTLIDSEPYWIEAEKDLARGFGVDWTDEDGMLLVGNNLPTSAQILIDRGVDMEPGDLIDHLLVRVTARVRESVPWQPDARALLEKVLAAGIPCALVTASYRLFADAFVSRAPDAFAAVVAGDDVERGKPAPDPYLLAAQRLGVPIERCVAIEDSRTGIASAHASGAATLGVHRLVPIEPRPGLSRVRSLEGLDVAFLGRLVQGEVVDELADAV
ncbi:HAD family hydrolase [Demequina pelophila]|uniref:HAD family hydrolase n=1 Tax=Demequina pelophila TaxID=1638984 RepID=UPI000A4422F7|nr:HAD family phosphatase [Demequina pelophila]